MALTRDFKETVVARVQTDPAFAQALLDEAVTLFVNGEPPYGQADPARSGECHHRLRVSGRAGTAHGADAVTGDEGHGYQRDDFSLSMRLDEARASLSSLSQSSGGWPPSSILRNTR